MTIEGLANQLQLVVPQVFTASGRLTGTQFVQQVVGQMLKAQFLLALLAHGEQQLGMEHLPDNLLDELRAGEPLAPRGNLRDNQLALIRQALDRHHGNASAAAQALGISRATLYRKLKQMTQ